MFLRWSDVNFELRTMRVTSKPELGFYLQRWEDREIPAPVELNRGGRICLVQRSKAWHSRHIGRVPSPLHSFGGSLVSRLGWRSTLF
jgi:hypothetical protein